METLLLKQTTRGKKQKENYTYFKVGSTSICLILDNTRTSTKYYFASVFTVSLSSHTCRVDGPQGRDWGSKVPPTVREDQVCDHLRNLNIHKSMGSDEMHPRRNWMMYLPSHSPRYLKSHDSQLKSPVTGKRETLHPFLKRVERRTLGTTDLSASPLCLGRSWNRSS